MGETKFTPGPWAVKTLRRGSVNVYSGPRYVAEVGNIKVTDLEQLALIRADARLIAAAPDMFKALERISLFVCYATEENTDPQVRADVLLQVGKLARAAIIAAEGDSNQ